MNDSLVEDLQDAFDVNMNVKLINVISGIHIIASGYNQQINKLISNVVNHLINKKISDNIFLIKKNALKNMYINNMYINPINQAIKHMRELLIQNYITVDDKLKVINEITLDKLNEYRKKLLKKLYVKFLIQGNITKEETIKLVKLTVHDLSYEPIKTDKIVDKVIQLNKQYFYKVQSTNKKENNSGVLCIYQIGLNNFKLINIVELLRIIIKQSYISQLRTNEQLAYNLGTKILIKGKIIHFGFLIISSAKSPTYLQKRIDIFIENFLDILKKMDNDTFNIYIDSLIDSYNKKYISMEEEFTNNYKEIIDEEYIFDRKIINAQVIKKIKKKDLINFYKENIISKKKNLNIHIHGNSSDDKSITKIFSNLPAI